MLIGWVAAGLGLVRTLPAGLGCVPLAPTLALAVAKAAHPSRVFLAHKRSARAATHDTRPRTGGRYVL